MQFRIRPQVQNKWIKKDSNCNRQNCFGFFLFDRHVFNWFDFHWNRDVPMKSWLAVIHSVQMWMQELMKSKTGFRNWFSAFVLHSFWAQLISNLSFFWTEEKKKTIENTKKIHKKNYSSKIISSIPFIWITFSTFLILALIICRGHNQC